MNCVCKLFGHQPKNYGDVSSIVVDGIGRTHAGIKAECKRCGATFSVCKIHLPTKLNK